MSELYKGFTQHLRSSKIDDETPGAILGMEMISGLYVMKQIHQEGYVLPVCKFINNLRSDVMGSFPVITPGKCTHPRFDYATIVDGEVNVTNTDTIPDTIAGGIVSINNLMKTRTIPRYTDLTSGNLYELEANGYINIVDSYIFNEMQAFVLTIKKSCTLVGQDIKYQFNVTDRLEDIVDFEAIVL